MLLLTSACLRIAETQVTCVQIHGYPRKLTILNTLYQALSIWLGTHFTQRYGQILLKKIA